jgi:hypothetical protein
MKTLATAASSPATPAGKHPQAETPVTGRRFRLDVLKFNSQKRGGLRADLSDAALRWPWGRPFTPPDQDRKSTLTQFARDPIRA